MKLAIAVLGIMLGCGCKTPQYPPSADNPLPHWDEGKGTDAPYDYGSWECPDGFYKESGDGKVWCVANKVKQQEMEEYERQFKPGPAPK
jgi:hypothetical protein